MRVFVCVARRGSDGGAGECMRGPSGYLAPRTHSLSLSKRSERNASSTFQEFAFLESKGRREYSPFRHSFREGAGRRKGGRQVPPAESARHSATKHASTCVCTEYTTGHASTCARTQYTTEHASRCACACSIQLSTLEGVCACTHVRVCVCRH